MATKRLAFLEGTLHGAFIWKSVCDITLYSLLGLALPYKKNLIGVTDNTLKFGKYAKGCPSSWWRSAFPFEPVHGHTAYSRSGQASVIRHPLNTCGTPTTMSRPGLFQRINKSCGGIIRLWQWRDASRLHDYERCYKMAYCTCLRRGWSFATNV